MVIKVSLKFHIAPTIPHHDTEKCVKIIGDALLTVKDSSRIGHSSESEFTDLDTALSYYCLE